MHARQGRLHGRHLGSARSQSIRGEGYGRVREYDEMVGKDFEDGLANLKSAAEK